MLVRELSELDAKDAIEVGDSVMAWVDPPALYRLLLAARVANRVTLYLARGEVASADELGALVMGVDWSATVTPEARLAMRFSGRCPGIDHSRYGAQRIRDAVSDRLRADGGSPPQIDLERPQLVVEAEVRGGVARVGLDLGGGSIHGRGYRPDNASAPLRETLAAALLMRCEWPRIAAEGGSLVDPFCGSGTLLAEAWLMATATPPRLHHPLSGLSAWRGHQPELLEAERARLAEGVRPIQGVRLFGSDRDPAAVALAERSLSALGAGDAVELSVREVDALEAPAGTGLLLTNPPYGERVGADEDLAAVYRGLGARLIEGFQGWEAAVLAGDPQLGRHIGLKAWRSHRYMNGPIECRLLRFKVQGDDQHTPAPRTVGGDTRAVDPRRAQGERPRMLANRLRKNLRHLRRWARREGVSCYRVYDADLPEYAFAADRYESRGGVWLHLQEYAPPASIPDGVARERAAEALAVFAEVLELPADHIVLKRRERQRGGQQYADIDGPTRELVVEEGGLRFLVNLTEHLDTGLFLDHRPARARVRELSEGRDVLNLFCYTGSVSVYAAAGGARKTVSVDLSRTYLDVARRNLGLNGFEVGGSHRLEHADALAWLVERRAALTDPRQRPERFGLIFLDPPTISRSARMEGDLDVQRDHVRMIRDAAALLTRDGLLLFSTNFRRFKLDAEALSDLEIEETTARSVPEDFRRDPRIHRCWEIRRR